MWVDQAPVSRDWQGGAIVITEMLYEFDAPVIFRARVGFNDFLFAKRDEGEELDFYFAVETSDQIIRALREGRLSLRGALYQKEAWIIESDLNTVSGFQHLNEAALINFLPAKNVGLLSRFGIVPDTVEQADAFISFRFLGSSVQNGRVSLTVLQEKVNQFSDFVKRALTPPTLNNGRDYRFFDVQMAEPRFSSLVLAAKKPEFDNPSLARSPRLRDVSPEALAREASSQGEIFWHSLEFATAQIARTGRLSDDFINRESDFLHNLEGLLPSVEEGLDRVEITFNGGVGLQTVLIDRNIGEQISDAQDRLRRAQTRTLNGVIMEVNGEAKTFIIKDLTQRQTTCAIPYATFDRLDDRGDLRRGRQISITGEFTKRTRRDYIWSDQAIVFLN